MKKYIFKLFLFLELILVFSWFLGKRFVPVKTIVFLGERAEEFKNYSLFWSRANFNGIHYVSIARSGYGYLQEAFFPFYPALIRFFRIFLGSYLISGLFVSNLFFILAMIMFWKLLSLEKVKKEKIKKSLLFLVLFPTAFYFLGAYAESLFLFLVLSSFYFAKKGRFGLAGLIAGLASYTQLTGIFLLPALLVEYYHQASRRRMGERLVALRERITNPRRNGFVYLIKSRFNHFRRLIHISLSSWGLFAYGYHLKRTTGSWLSFIPYIKTQPGFGGQRTIDKLILLYQVFWRYLKMIVAVNPRQWLYFNVWLELLISTLFLGLLLWGWYKREKYKIRSSWLTFATLCYLLPTFTGTFISMPRYVLTCFPCFAVLVHVLEDLKKRFRRIEILYMAVSVILLIICSTFFFRGYWAA